MFRATILPNGLTVIAEVHPHANTTALGIFVRTGARDEFPATGVTHALEHMVFKGPGGLSGIEMNQWTARMGAQVNAFTGAESTVFYMGFLPQHLPSAMRFLCALMSPAFQPQEFFLEMNVVMEEIDRAKDDPFSWLYTVASEAYFSGHPVGNRILGTRETVGALTPEGMRDYFSGHYVPSNMVLAATGNLEWERLVELAEECFGSWKPGITERVYPPHGALDKLTTPLDLKMPGLGTAYVIMIGQGAPELHRSAAAGEILATLLGGAPTSQAYWRLVVPGIAPFVQVWTTQMDRIGSLTAGAQCERARVDEVIDELTSILSSPLSFTEDDLTRVRGWKSARVALHNQTPMQRIFSLGLVWLSERCYLPVADMCARYRQVTMEDIRRYVSEFPTLPTLISVMRSE